MRTLPKLVIMLFLITSPGWGIADPTKIEHPEKIGLGSWPRTGDRAMAAQVRMLGARWFYAWGPQLEHRTAGFVPMVWGGADMQKLHTIDRDSAAALLTFNEPDHPDQSNLSVDAALSYWPRLEALGLRLGSPAAARIENGKIPWLDRFMEGARDRGYRVDFIAVHYYPTNPDIEVFRHFLEAVHQRYRRPIWVTEWALADWQRPDRFTVEQQRQFLVAGAHMLDDLWFVERHAWFGAFEGLGAIRLNSGVTDDQGKLTPVGVAFRKLTGGHKAPEI